MCTLPSSREFMGSLELNLFENKILATAIICYK